MPHYIQSHLHTQTTVSPQATLHPVPFSFLNYHFSSGNITSSPIFISKFQFQLRPHYIQSHLHSQNTVSSQATLLPVPFSFLHYHFSSGKITSSTIFISKFQFQLRPHYIQSHLHSQTTVSPQAILHPVPFSFLNYHFSSGNITSSSIFIPKLQFQLRPGHITSSPIFTSKFQLQLRPHYIQSHLHSPTTVPAQATLHPVPSSFSNYSFSPGHLTSSPIFIPKLQFQLRPHYIQSHLHFPTTVLAQSSLHPVPSSLPNYSLSSGHITSSPIFFPKLQFQLRPHNIQSHLLSQITLPAQATLHPVPSSFPNYSFSLGHITSLPLHSTVKC